MKRRRGLPVMLMVFAAMLLVIGAIEPAIVQAGDEVVFEEPIDTSLEQADAAFGIGSTGSTPEVKEPSYAAADAAFAEEAVSAPVDDGGGTAKIDDMGAYARTNLGAIPASVMASMTYEQYEAYRRSKAEAYALTDSSYGTADFIPARQEALERLIQQAKDMQFSQAMVDELARIFKLVDYVDYDYHVRFGKNPDNYLKLLKQQHRLREEQMRKKAIFARRLKSLRKQTAGDEGFEGDGGGMNIDKNNGDEPEFHGDGGGVNVDKNGNSAFVGPMGAGDKDWSVSKLREQLDQYAGAAGAREIPDDVVRSIEASVHNAILEKLKARGYDVAALNVFLQNLNEVKVIAIITTSELPKSAIRSTLKSVRSMIETEVLQKKFKALRLAQLSSFTILNEVDNTFYEHPVLYWQMQLTGWDAKGRRVSPGTPAAADILPQADSSPEADELLKEFLGN